MRPDVFQVSEAGSPCPGEYVKGNVDKLGEGFYHVFSHRRAEERMGSEQQELDGPDLTQGVPLDDLTDGAILTGHANGEAVVVVRTDGEVFAIDANCTHYGVPLGGGVVVGHT